MNTQQMHHVSAQGVSHIYTIEVYNMVQMVRTYLEEVDCHWMNSVMVPTENSLHEQCNT